MTQQSRSLGASLYKGTPTEWPTTIRAAQRQKTIAYNGIKHPRIPYGEETWGYYKFDQKPTQPCSDCGVLPGQLHVTTCDMEQCPLCSSKQRISCVPHWFNNPNHGG